MMTGIEILKDGVDKRVGPGRYTWVVELADSRSMKVSADDVSVGEAGVLIFTFESRPALIMRCQTWLFLYQMGDDYEPLVIEYLPAPEVPARQAAPRAC